MDSKTPTPDAPPTQTMQPSILDRVRQHVQLTGLREQLRKANVPDATANNVVNQTAQAQSSSIAFGCHVAQIGTTQDFAWVTIVRRLGEMGHPLQTYDLLFPPNDPKYLAEFVRAQNYQFPIWLSLNMQPGQEPTIEYINVGAAPSAQVSGAPPEAQQ